MNLIMDRFYKLSLNWFSNIVRKPSNVDHKLAQLFKSLAFGQLGLKFILWEIKDNFIREPGSLKPRPALTLSELSVERVSLVTLLVGLPLPQFLGGKLH